VGLLYVERHIPFHVHELFTTLKKEARLDNYQHDIPL